MNLLVTGAAGFIGAALAHRLLDRGDTVVGLDNLNDYYEVSLKEARLARLAARPGFRFVRLDLADRAGMRTLFAGERFDAVAHLAAQAGVRYSLKNPDAYVDSNLVGFGNVLEGCRHTRVGHLVYASSSSVYGLNAKMPFSEEDSVDHPVSLYAATKKANELMAHVYSHLYALPTTGLRFFTVYGPWGRPDMSPYLFIRAMLAGEPIKVFNHGEMLRDFTYVDDIVEGVVRVIDRPPSSGDASLLDSPATSTAPYRVYNIGNSQPVRLLDYIATFERALGVKAKLDLQPMQPGDVVATAADTTALERAVGFRPSTPLAVGVQRFVDWYREFYKVPASRG
ncbi:MAG: NAD-dependent epimerase [Burkholderiales bacterium]|jgi:UDP-glucuronate 4-epimerase|nr:NAD-dependent epimerase [Burkholderiales bacterium]